MAKLQCWLLLEKSDTNRISLAVKRDRVFSERKTDDSVVDLLSWNNGRRR
jgi:hypothetical protein